MQGGGRWRHSPLWPDRDSGTHPQNRHLLATRPGSCTGHRGRARPSHRQRPRTENHPPAGPGADGLERHSSGESQVLIRGFKKWPRNQQIALPILSVFAFGALFNQMQARNSEPVSIHVENPRIIDGDTLETLDKKRVRLSGRTEEHTSELQSIMRISYAVFCLKKKKKITHK